MRLEHRGKDLPVATPGCPAVKWDNIGMPAPPSFPVDLTGEVSGDYSRYTSPPDSKFSMCIEPLDDDPTKVEVCSGFDAGSYPYIDPSSRDTDPRLRMGAVEVVVPALVLPEGSDLLQIANAIDENPQATARVGELLGERVIHCPCVPSDGQCGALGGTALGEILNRTAQEFNFQPGER